MPSVRGLAGEYSQLAGLRQHLELGVRPQCLQQGADVVANCGLREVEFLADLPDRLALRQQLQDLKLPRREGGDIVPSRRRSLLLGGELDEALSHLKSVVGPLGVA